MKTLDIEKLFERARETAKTCPTAAEAIKGLLPEAFEKEFSYEGGEIILTTNGPALFSWSKGGYTYLNSGEWDPPKQTEERDARPMRSGTITLTVKNGKIAGAQVTET